MYKFFSKILSIVTKNNGEKIMIKNISLPICKNCKYFENYNNKELYNLGECTKFGEKDIISGIIKYYYASICRIFDNLCGKKGKYFQEKVETIIK